MSASSLLNNEGNGLGFTRQPMVDAAITRGTIIAQGWAQIGVAVPGSGVATPGEASFYLNNWDGSTGSPYPGSVTGSPLLKLPAIYATAQSTLVAVSAGGSAASSAATVFYSGTALADANGILTLGRVQASTTAPTAAVVLNTTDASWVRWFVINTNLTA